MKKLLLLLPVWMVFNVTQSQPFVYVDAHFVEVMQGAGSWVDYDKDGYLDAFITGDRYSGNEQFIVTELYKNKKKGEFIEVNTGIADVYLSALDWGDYDKDGDEDLVLTGETRDGKLVSAIYKNNRTYFTKLKTNLTPVRDGSVQWGDYDNDGDLDILLSGESYQEQIVTKVYVNQGQGKFAETDIALAPVYLGTARWADYDGDGDYDILLAGLGTNRVIVSKLYRNEGANQFVEVPTGISPVKFSDAQWGDLDNDEDLDFIICGESYGGKILTEAYRNNGNGTFSKVTPNLEGARSGNIDLGDYDQDGDLDVVITGESPNWAITKIYRNDGNFVFTDIYAGLPGVSMGGAYWGDYDKDGDLDILLLGLDNCFDFTSKIYRNDGVYQRKIKEKEPESSIWITREMYHSRPTYYYFVYASCYCDPFSEGVKNFHAFVGNVHQSPRKFELMERFNQIIMNNLVNWPRTGNAHRVSIGFVSEEEAKEGRKRVMDDYKSEGFIIHYVNW